MLRTGSHARCDLCLALLRVISHRGFGTCNTLVGFSRLRGFLDALRIWVFGPLISHWCLVISHCGSAALYCNPSKSSWAARNFGRHWEWKAWALISHSGLGVSHSRRMLDGSIWLRPRAALWIFQFRSCML